MDIPSSPSSGRNRACAFGFEAPKKVFVSFYCSPLTHRDPPAVQSISLSREFQKPPAEEQSSEPPLKEAARRDSRWKSTVNKLNSRQSVIWKEVKGMDRPHI